MSPSHFAAAGGAARDWRLLSVGSLTGTWVIDDYAARPVINLKSDVKIISGTGTANDPYVVDTNN